MTTEREAFEANIRKTRPTHCDLRKSKKGEYLYSIEKQSWKTWQAACAWQRERDALLCESLGTATNGIYERNQECADKIRIGE